MSTKVAVIGDIHGNARALGGVLKHALRAEHVVFVGDYVDRGSESSKVIDMLIEFEASRSQRTTFLMGNHDAAFLACIEKGGPALIDYLRIGGASTIRSYVTDLDADLVRQLRRSVPSAHLSFLRRLRPDYRDGQLLVTHAPQDGHPAVLAGDKFHVFGHSIQRTLKPKLTPSSASIDTGCGSLPDGRLTCFWWPSGTYVQVDHQGRPVTDTCRSLGDRGQG